MKDWRKHSYFFGLILLVIIVFYSANIFASTAEITSELEDVYEGPRLVINVPARELSLYDANDNLVKTYQIAVGRSIYPTPVGRRYMNQIVWNPWWIPPKSSWAKDDVKTPPGPRNPLGPVKMKLSSSIMIHGTSRPSSIGRAASHGCMRMHSAQAKELARYLQESVTDLSNDSLFKQYEKNSKRSYYVNLDKKIPVDIVYEVVQVKENTLYVYQDIYAKFRNKSSLVEKALLEKGYDLDDVDVGYIKKQINKARSSDLTFDLPRLMVKKRNKELSQLASNL